MNFTSPAFFYHFFAIAHAHTLRFAYKWTQINKSNDDNVEFCRIMCWLSSYCFGEIFVSRYDGVTGVFATVSVDTECPKTQLNIIRKWARAGVTLTMTTAF